MGHRRTLVARLRTRIDRSGAQDCGFTLVEVVVALGMILIIMAVLGVGILETERAQRTAEAMNQAVQEASSVLHTDSTGGWGNIGFYTDEPGYAATAANGEQTVALGSVSPAGWVDRFIPPTATATIGRYTYAISTSITWADDSSAGTSSTTPTFHYKRILVTVAATHDGETAKVTQQSLIAPSPLDYAPPNAPTSLTSECNTNAPFTDAGNPFCNVATTSGMVCSSTDANSNCYTTIPVDFTATIDLPGVTGVTATLLGPYNPASTPTQSSVTLTLTQGSNPNVWSTTLPVGSYEHTSGTVTYTATTSSGTTYTAPEDVRWVSGQ